LEQADKLQKNQNTKQVVQKVFNILQVMKFTLVNYQVVPSVLTMKSLKNTILIITDIITFRRITRTSSIKLKNDFLQ